MMAHLFANVFEFWADILVGLTQDWIEWLACTLGSASVLGRTKGSNHHEADLRIRFLVCPDQHILVLHNLHNLLDH